MKFPTHDLFNTIHFYFHSHGPKTKIIKGLYCNSVFLDLAV